MISIIKQLDEDIEFYKYLLSEYESLSSEDYKYAYDLSKQALMTADRWNEIMLDSLKYSKELDILKSKFETWCYQKWKMLMKIHEFCRIVYRQGADGITNSFYNE